VFFLLLESREGLWAFAAHCFTNPPGSAAPPKPQPQKPRTRTPQKKKTKTKTKTKTRARPSRAPRAGAHAVHAPTAGATTVPRRSSRQHTGRRDPRLRRARHPSSCLRRGLEPRAPDPLATSVRPAAGLCRCVRRTSRLGLFPPRQSVLQPTKEDLRLRPPDRGSPALPQVEHGTPVLRLPPRGFRSDINPPSRPPPASPR
jgi:hypothetical protein